MKLSEKYKDSRKILFPMADDKDTGIYCLDFINLKFYEEILRMEEQKSVLENIGGYTIEVDEINEKLSELAKKSNLC